MTLDPATIGKKNLVPQKKIRKTLKRVIPLVNHDGQLQQIATHTVDPYRESFLWDPVFLGPLSFEIEPYAEIETYHTFGYYGLFKPTLAEVIQRLPDDPHLVAFHVEGPKTADDLNRQKDAMNAGYHIAKCTLYRRK